MKVKKLIKTLTCGENKISKNPNQNVKKKAKQ